MVKVSIEARNGAASFCVSVQAESTGRAVSILGGRYPKGNIRVKSAMDPRGPFVGNLAAIAGIDEFEQPERVAA